MSDWSYSDLPPELIQIVFQSVDSVKDFVNLGSVSIFFRFLAYQIEFEPYVELDTDQIENVLSRYKFTSVKISNKYYFSGSKLKRMIQIYQNRGLAMKRLDLSLCVDISDNDLENLSEVPELNFSHCHFKGDGLRYLKKCQIINLSHTGIKNIHTTELSHCRKIILDYCYYLTFKCLKNLTSCQYLSVVGCVFMGLPKAFEDFKKDAIINPDPYQMKWPEYFESINLSECNANQSVGGVAND